MAGLIVGFLAVSEKLVLNHTLAVLQLLSEHWICFISMVNESAEDLLSDSGHQLDVKYLHHIP